MNLKQLLSEAAQRYKDKTAVTMGERRLSYAELEDASNKVANALLEMGVTKGDRVAMLMSNCPEFIVTYFGITKTGAIAVPLDTKYKTTEVAAIFSDCEPKVLFTESPYLEALVPAMSQSKSIKQVINLTSDGKSQSINYQDIIATASTQDVPIEIRPDDIAHITYTSGPTLHPRGVMLPHSSLVTEATISAQGFNQTDKDTIVLFALPLHHAFGLVVIVFTSIIKGSKVIMIPGLSISSLMETIETERATMFMGVPFVHALVVEMAEEKGIEHDLSSLRLYGSAGAPLPVTLAQRFEKLFGMKIVDFWGQTESSAHITCQSLNGSAKLGSVGKALPGWELKVVDEQGQELPAHQIGELIVKGPIMKGIYNNSQVTAKFITDGWLHTGDIGKIDEEGNVFLFGNNKGMLISKGQNIHPSDIEEVLCSHPKIARATVVGLPDEARGHVIRAVVTLNKGESITEHEVKHFCLERIANYKVPKQVIVIDALPMTADGKVDKESLKKLPYQSGKGTSAG